MGKRKRKYFKLSRRLVNQLKSLSIQYEVRKEPPSKIISNEIVLTTVDRITHIRKADHKGNILEVVNVSYEIKLGKKWVTIIRYDSLHTHLHRHMLTSMDTGTETVNRERVIKKGSPGTWYTWAIKDIQKRYLEYRTGFAKRNKLPNIGY